MIKKAKKETASQDGRHGAKLDDETYQQARRIAYWQRIGIKTAIARGVQMYWDSLGPMGPLPDDES